MVNQSTPEDDTSAVQYIEEYLDCVENLPNDLQRQLSRLLDLDAQCQQYIREFDRHGLVLAKVKEDTPDRRRALYHIQRNLIFMHNIGDEKLQIMQTIQDTIDKKAKQLAKKYRKTNPLLEQENHQPLNSNCINDRSIRRGRKTRSDGASNTSQDANVLTENHSANIPSTSNGSQKQTSIANNRKKRKTKSNSNQSREETSSPFVNDEDVELDEPLYCICNQISYGKMIMCDNNACSLQWFHFACVAITAKPKGKWYCPHCRGSKANIMNSKAQLRCHKEANTFI